MGNLLKPENLNLDLIFDKVILSLNDGFCTVEKIPDGKITYEFHPVFWTKLGHSKAPLKDNDWFELIDAGEREKFLARIDKFYSSGKSSITHYLPINNSKKEILWFNTQIVRMGEQEGALSFLMMFKDISAKKRETELLKEGQRIVKMGYWEYDLRNQNIHWSDVTKEIHGVDKDYIPSLEKAINFYPEGKARETIEDKLSKAINNHESFLVELELQKLDGSFLWVESRGRPMIENGECVRLVGTFMDISQRRKVENELRVSEESFKGAFEHSAIGMGLVSPDGKWLKVNESVSEITGYTNAELMNLTFADLTHPDDLEADLKLLKELIDGTRNSYKLEKRYIHKEGNIIWVILAVSMVKDEEGKPLHFVSQITDVTERKNTSIKLENALHRIQSLLDAATQVAIISTDLEGTIVNFNKGAENLLGYKSSEVVGITSPALVHDLDEMMKRSQELTLKHGRPIEGFGIFTHFSKFKKFESREWTYIKKNGNRFPVQLVVTAIYNNERDIIGYLGVATDISERKESESLLQRMAILESKSAEMEQFAYITSHDLREPLLTISNYIGLIDEEYGEAFDEKARKFFGFIAEASQNMNELINDLLTYSRLSKVNNYDTIDLNRTVNKVITNLETTISKENAIIKFDTLPIVNGHKQHLYLLFQNLIHNSIKFHKEGVSPIIKISCREDENSWVFDVEDNGIGIDDKMHDKIFTIFQKLHDKKAYEGTGIGLSIVKKICELHNGVISVSNGRLGGTRFTFNIQTKKATD
ncbi:MAG: PAS domain S-box-containing protein [Psychromonas sp.]|jgi:PAS domain S-box-containing protein